VDERAVGDLGLAVVSLGLWSFLYIGARLLTRPADPRPEPATMELGPEPPALVSLLVNRWTLTEDAAESTLLDLAARKFFELRQPGSDPVHTTVHLPRTPPEAGALRPYERMVLDRVRGLAVDGVVPLSALTFRDAGQAQSWNKRLRAAVIAEAREAGLSRRRFGKGLTTFLVFAAVAAAIGVGLAALHYGLWNPGKDNDDPGIGTGIVAFGVLSFIVGRTGGERDTPEGRKVAARWLGVRDWLRGHDQFAELPPAAVAVWDRYLGYGAAVGATRLASAVLDLDMGNRKLVWSSFGDTWHRVRVRYPRFWPRYGRPLPRLLLRSALCLFAGGVIFHLMGRPEFAPQPGTNKWAHLLVAVIESLGPLLIALGAYTFVRSLLDLVTERTITGEVLWIEVWESSGGGEDAPPVPWLHYLAIDDGTADRTTAWALPSVFSDRSTDGDTVTIRVRPWSRRIGEITVVGRGRSRELVETVTAEDTGSLAVSMMAPAATPFSFAVADVSQMLGVEVTGTPLPMAGTQYAPVAGGKPLLLIQSVSGLPGRVAWRANSRGTELPGVLDGAFLSGERAAVRHGDTTVVLTLLGEARSRSEFLPWLLGQAAGRSG
jgi:hypothetical protein